MFKKETFIDGKLSSGRIYPEFFPIDSNDSVVNFGCGQGVQALIYAGRFKEMIGIDINCEKLERDSVKVKNYKTLCANVEKVPLKPEIFNKAIAIDIIEHVQNPSKFCAEIYRLLKDNGELLITFPMTYDKYRDFISWIGRFFFGRKKLKSVGWNPDMHNQRNSPTKWINMVKLNGFNLEKMRATTLFPPLHLFGIPRFWFNIKIIHKIDSFFCKTPIIRRLGLTMMCVFKKKL